MVTIDFITISDRLQSLSLPRVDLVLGIATGGIVPASLVAYQLRCDLHIISFNYRDQQNRPQHDAPVLLNEIWLPDGVNSILLVDDVSVSGKTLEAAKKHLSNYSVTTLVMKGKADFVVLPEVNTCVNWPWKVKQTP